MKKLVNLLNRKPYLRFFASVQLAIPLLLTLAGAAAAGTIVESRYSTDYARLLIYDSVWFHFLLMLLWINIFLSTLSRYPYQQKHLGFVIVHVGLMTLLIGGFVTSKYGTDGQLRVEESSQSSKVMLNDLSLELIDVQTNSILRAPFARSASKLSGSSLDFLNERFHSTIVAREYMPFAEVKEGFAETSSGEAGVVAVGFMLKSQFFDVSEWLNTAERPEMTMGPATVRLVVDRAETKRTVTKAKKTKPIAMSTESDRLIIRDEAAGKVLKDIRISQLGPGFEVKPGVKIAAAKVYRHAVVMNNHLAEGDQAEPNPAVELTVQTGKKTIREIAYAKFPNFSLNQGKGGTFGLKFEYSMGGADRSVGSDEGGMAESSSSAPSGSRAGHVIEFHTSPNGGDDVRVELYKDNQLVMNQSLKAGEAITTPWMGMKLTLGSVKRNAQSTSEVTEAQVLPRMDLPPSAIYVTTAGQTAVQGFWLAEGQFKRVQVMGREYEVYFGRETLDLPFSLQLVEFKKLDYPGTETPMSFSSRVKVNGHDPENTISMNEPLKYDGYTIYQSSYDVRPGQPRASIFSVNMDPGRAIKYFGGLILAIGIITFTLMRSRAFKKTKVGNHA